MRSKLRIEVLAALFTALAVLLFALSALAVAALNLPVVAVFDVLAIRSPKISTQTIQLNISVATYTPSPTINSPTPASTPTFTPTLTPTWTPSPLPTDTATVTSTVTATDWPITSFDAGARNFIIGQSVQGRDIGGIAFPSNGESAQALVFVCGMHGDETNAWSVLGSLISNLDDGALSQPPALGLYFINALNPDGAAINRRLNANGVDLNRNWETYDWRTGIEVSPADYLPTGGGSTPFSEPETRAMRDWLLALQAQYPGGVTVIYFHAAFPPKGLVMPGAHFVDGQDLADTPSRHLGERLSVATGYRYDNRWPGGYRVTGDASTWAVAQGMQSLTVELPVRGALDATQFGKLREGILAAIEFLSR
ncbi:MAG TPA: DUF2817 domain-containing protein [Anaerolineales bacterium]|nr:DUF2817 domain-containing protein [Anaerolineales bacterium]